MTAEETNKFEQDSVNPSQDVITGTDTWQDACDYQRYQQRYPDRLLYSSVLMTGLEVMQCQPIAEFKVETISKTSLVNKKIYSSSVNTNSHKAHLTSERRAKCPRIS